MKLYFSAGACSLAPHILAAEAGLTVKPIAVNLKTKEYAGGDFTKINPLGYVPVLETDDGTTITEVATILQYIAERKPEKNLVPTTGPERYQTLQWLAFIASELHKGFAPLWADTTPPEMKKMVTERLYTRFDFVEKNLSQKGPYLMGSTFTAPDAYLFTVMSWTKYLNMNMSKWPKIMSYLETVATRPAVQTAMKAEGLIK